ncbi:MAG: RcnB family protein [Erythrobacter sp.]|nr:RcnB family protein [Erythrobacter sp.]
MMATALPATAAPVGLGAEVTLAQRSDRGQQRGERTRRQVPPQIRQQIRDRRAQSQERNARHQDWRQDRRENRQDWREDRRDRRDDRRDWREDRRDDRRDWREDRRDDRREWRQDGRNYRDFYRDARQDYRRWDQRSWRNNQRYDWQRYRASNRSLFSIGRYYSPYRTHRYSRVNVGFRLQNLFYGSRYQINDPWRYRLPPVYGPYRWIRYYDDVLLVDSYDGRVVDVIYDFFW